MTGLGLGKKLCSLSINGITLTNFVEITWLLLVYLYIHCILLVSAMSVHIFCRLVMKHEQI